MREFVLFPSPTLEARFQSPKEGETYERWMERDRGEKSERKRQKGETEGKRQR